MLICFCCIVTFLKMRRFVLLLRSSESQGLSSASAAKSVVYDAKKHMKNLAEDHFPHFCVF